MGKAPQNCGGSFKQLLRRSFSNAEIKATQKEIAGLEAELSALLKRRTELVSAKKAIDEGKVVAQSQLQQTLQDSRRAFLALPPERLLGENLGWIEKLLPGEKERFAAALEELKRVRSLMTREKLDQELKALEVRREILEADVTETEQLMAMGIQFQTSRMIEEHGAELAKTKKRIEEIRSGKVKPLSDEALREEWDRIDTRLNDLKATVLAELGRTPGVLDRYLRERIQRVMDDAEFIQQRSSIESELQSNQYQSDLKRGEIKKANEKLPEVVRKHNQARQYLAAIAGGAGTAAYWLWQYMSEPQRK